MIERSKNLYLSVKPCLRDVVHFILDGRHGDDRAGAAISGRIDSAERSTPDTLDRFIIGNLNSKGVKAATFCLDRGERGAGARISTAKITRRRPRWDKWGKACSFVRRNWVLGSTNSSFPRIPGIISLSPMPIPPAGPKSTEGLDATMTSDNQCKCN